MTDIAVGPIDYLAVEFPDGQLKGEGLAEIIKLTDAGIIRVLDLRVVRREQDGTFTAALIGDFDDDGALDLAVFAGIESGLLGDEDLAATAELIEPGTAAAVIVYENTWAGPFVAAMLPRRCPGDGQRPDPGGRGDRCSGRSGRGPSRSSKPRSPQLPTS